ncbi:hypothetical protein GCM10009682_56320 [Luedemannella flava]|uniref:N-acetyltransferase domain-containing protein n=1 Tax=Luedemannella flava TaxID=349316 RepID=A0ABP4YTT9_9ACTN
MDTVRVKHVTPGAMTAGEREQFAALVDEVADDFVPPLTDRRGTTETQLNGPTGSQPTNYLDALLTQHNLLVFEGDRLTAFLSYRLGHHIAELPEVGACTYVSTIAVARDRRRAGHARLLYGQLMPLASSWIVLRTWSTNTSHIRLLQALGFKELYTLEDHRGAGLDTVYFGLDQSSGTVASSPRSSATTCH